MVFILLMKNITLNHSIKVDEKYAHKGNHKKAIKIGQT